jgi:hypothetical protein
VKMHTNAPKSKLAQENLDLLCDLELLLNLPCILPMLEAVHTLIIYVQRQDVFICEFIDAMKSVEAELHQLYVDPFCNMMILFSMDSLLLVNIVVSCCLPPRFHMNLMLINTCCHTWHSTLLAITTNSIIVEVLMVVMFM